MKDKNLDQTEDYVQRKVKKMCPSTLTARSLTKPEISLDFLQS